jgi:uncharacterized protein with ATP-grasp and redox domains
VKTELECVACIVNQAVESPARFTDDPAARERILRQTLRQLADFDRSRTPPELGAMLCRIISDTIGDPDPFLSEKRRLNRLALDLLPELEPLVRSAGDPFAAAVRAAIAGNVIDFGAPGGKTEGVREELVGALDRPLLGGAQPALERLQEAVGDARSILYLADNAGEIAIDRLLIEQLPRGTVTVVVRSGPAINDALVEDAETVGLDRIAEVIDSGAAMPGTLLSQCSEELRERFRTADAIVSKGQGNFETLYGEPGPVWYLLRAKCKVVARQIGCAPGDFAIVENGSLELA